VKNLIGTNRKFIKLFLKFRYAFNGLKSTFKMHSSFRIHIIVAILVYLFGILLHLDLVQWVFISTAIIFVIVSELFNTAIEHICDFIYPKHHKAIKIIKDISAAAVLISVLNAIIVGSIVFIPHIMEVLFG